MDWYGRARVRIRMGRAWVRRRAWGELDAVKLSNN